MAQEYQQPIQNEVSPRRTDGGMDEADKVDRIRDILFGPQMRDYDGRFQRLEDNLAREANEIRDDTQKRLEALERFIKAKWTRLTAGPLPNMASVVMLPINSAETW